MASGKLGEKVRTLREAKGLTPELLADRAKVSVSFITILEGGRGAEKPSAVIMQRIARALGVPLNKLSEEP